MTVAAAFCLVLAVGCATVHYALERKTPDAELLVVPPGFKNDAGDAALGISLNRDGSQDSNTGDLIDFAQTFAFIRDIEPGMHQIARILVRWKPMSQIARQRECRIPFRGHGGIRDASASPVQSRREAERSVFHYLQPRRA